ncbi:MAG: UvrD-helicase domain-containing protein [Neisseriaceae bacterium]
MSDNPISFDPFLINLTGVNFIEASAGTGKTYGIASIYARLITLEQLAIDQILVVTFTEAATEELKSRLRERLALIKNFLQHPEQEINEPFLCILLQQICQKALCISTIQKHLETQLNHFDKVAVYTIHSFCLKLLREEAFLSGTPFQINLVPHHHAQIKLYIEDFFRTYITPDPLYSLLFFVEGLTPVVLHRRIQAELQKPYPNRILIEDSVAQNLLTGLSQLNFQLEKILHSITSSSTEDFLALCSLGQNGPLKQNQFHFSTYQSLFQLVKSAPTLQVFHLLSKDEKLLRACKRLTFQEECLKKAYLRNTALVDKVKEQFNKLRPFLELAQCITTSLPLYKEVLAYWHAKLIHYLHQSMEQYKAKSLNRSFNDLLIDSLASLKENSPYYQSLIQRLNQKYQYVLIDEFQDTDPIQYLIFQRLFILQGTPTFLVGDPKQSIYQFRGADIATYLRAKADAQFFYTMDTNYRSTAGLVKLVNVLFSEREEPFQVPYLPYYPITAYRQAPKLEDSTHYWADLTLFKLSQKNHSRSQQTQWLCEVTAQIVVDLLSKAQQGKIQYEKRPLEAKDIALLVNNHEQARLLSQELNSQNVRCIKIEKQSIYQSKEAIVLLFFFKVCQKLFYQNQTNSSFEPPKNYLYYLLTTFLWGLKAREIKLIQRSDSLQQELLETLLIFFQQWQAKGLYAAFQRFSRHLKLEQRLIEEKKERTLTNLNQLLELLARQDQISTSPLELIQWLEAQIQAKDNFSVSSEENNLRLENDEHLVKIITIHAAKGLQFPIVICPFISYVCSKATAGRDTCITETVISSVSESFDLDGMKEQMRLLYVALTRAEEKLILLVEDQAYSFPSDKPTSSLTYLIARETINTIDESVSTWEAWKGWLHRHPELNTLVKLYETPPALVHFSAKNNQEILAPSLPTPCYQRPIIHHTSYSAISTQLHQQTLVSNKIGLDSAAKIEELENPALTIFTFPRGPLTGNFWHELLEKINFKKSISQQNKLIQQKLHEYMIGPQYSPTLLVQITHQVLENTLNTLITPTKTIRNFLPENSKRELPFTLYLTSELSLPILNDWWQRHEWPYLSIPLIETKPSKTIAETYLSGFIDWIGLENNELYLIDYKTNFLGNTTADYAKNHLLSEIQHHYYQLQALIYALAMKRYFQTLKYPIKAFHIRYLFLRGLQPGTNKGIWEWDIPYTALEDLECSLTRDLPIHTG